MNTNRDIRLRAIFCQGYANAENEADLIEGSDPDSVQARLIVFLNGTYTRLPRLKLPANRRAAPGDDKSSMSVFDDVRQTLLQTLRMNKPTDWRTLEQRVRSAYRQIQDTLALQEESTDVCSEKARDTAVAFCESFWMPVTAGKMLKAPTAVSTAVDAIIAALDPSGN